MITLNPMDGCPQCKWITDRGTTVLDEPCGLHQRISDLQNDLALTDQLLKHSNKQIEKLRAKLEAICGDIDDFIAEEFPEPNV